MEQKNIKEDPFRLVPLPLEPLTKQWIIKTIKELYRSNPKKSFRFFAKDKFKNNN